jgi:hypothetical protein
MYGDGMGAFEIYTYNRLTESYERQFSVSGNQGPNWHKLELDLPLDEYKYVSQQDVLKGLLIGHLDSPQSKFQISN